MSHRLPCGIYVNEDVGCVEVCDHLCSSFWSGIRESMRKENDKQIRKTE